MDPYEQVAQECLGWLHPPEGPALRKYGLEAGHLGAPLCEIGGYAGKSACWLGSAARDSGTLLFSVDWHRGSPEMAPDRECHHPEMVGTDGVFDSLPHFRANIRKAELERWVVPVAGNSGDVGRQWRTPLALVFIDGGHDDQTVMADFLRWEENIVSGGFLLFHDVPIPGIEAAAQVAVRSGYEYIDQVESLRILRKP